MAIAHRLAGAPLDFAALRDELAVPGEFSSAVLSDAQAAASDVDLPNDDATDIPFVTVDPPGSKDLDQAVHIAAADDGYLVSYAIADVGSFVRPGSALDQETQHRGETLYFPDARVPLHPPVLSEGAASLLPDQLCPAVLWQIGLDANGEVTSVDVRRARVRSREQLDYPTLHTALESGNAPQAVALLPTVGRLRTALARQRHAIDLDLPAQEVERDGDGWTLRFRQQLPVEQHNAQISLLTGICAASLMLQVGFGILRTVPPPDKRTIAALRRIAPALGVSWPQDALPGDVLTNLRRDDPRHVAFLDHAGSLLRGSAYTAFDGPPPPQPLHAGIAAPYAHVTAPLRRLVDRYGSEICLAAHAGHPIPDWVREGVPALPETMARSGQLAHEVDRAVLDATEAWLLKDRIGERFDATILESDDRAATIALDEPAVRARCTGSDLPVGERIGVRLIESDVATRAVRFERV
ncbi:MAG: RNB domain-containing ribonuclease [Actinomycetota bacterium]